MGACVAVQIQYKSSTNRLHRSLAAPAARPVGLLGWGLGNGVWLHLLRRGGGFSVQSASPAPHRALSARPHSSSQLGSGRTAAQLCNPLRVCCNFSAKDCQIVHSAGSWNIVGKVVKAIKLTKQRTSCQPLSLENYLKLSRS